MQKITKEQYIELRTPRYGSPMRRYSKIREQMLDLEVDEGFTISYESWNYKSYPSSVI